MEKPKCPYCLSDVNEKADNCKGCGHDVRKIFDLREELKKSNLRIKELELVLGVKTPPRADEHSKGIADGIRETAIRVVLALTIQLLFIAFGNKGQSFRGVTYDAYLIIGIIAALMVYLTFKKKKLNIWHILILFFTEPFICFYTVNFFYPSGLSTDLLPNVVRISSFNLLSVVIFSLILIPFIRASDRYFVFSFKPFFDRIYSPFDKLEKVDKFLLVIGSIVTSIITVYKFFH